MTASPLIDTTIAGRYKVVRLLGEGGMARVFEAEDELLARPVAVKVLRSRFVADEQFTERFWREARSAAGLSHPNIVHVYDYGRIDEGPSYIVMELIDGPTLGQLIEREGAMPDARATQLVEQAARGLGHAHAREMVHRDVKPQNMLIDTHGTLRVADFGIARAVDAGDTLTEVGSIIGTAQYLSPEQAQGRRATPASDVYALGVVLYELVTGVAPFRGGTVVEVALRHVQEQPAPPSELAPSIAPSLEALILRALSKEPERRFADGAAFAEALRSAERPAAEASTVVLHTQPEALPATELLAAAAPGSSRRRGRGALIAAALIFVALIAALVIWGMPGGEDERDPGGPTTSSANEPGKPPAARQVTVPGLDGLSLEQARAAAAPLGVVVSGTAPDENVPSDAVISQEPGEGAQRPAGSDIKVVLSSGQPVADEKGKGKDEEKPGKGQGKGKD